jgi:hypothetical protein
MINIPFPDKLASQLRAQAKAIGVNVPTLVADLLRERKKNLRRGLRQKQKKLSAAEIKRRMDLPHVREDKLDPALQELQISMLEREKW